MLRASVLRASWVVADAGDCVADGGVLLSGGQVRRVLRSPAAVARAARTEGVVVTELEGCLTAGLVNAHVHLELSYLAGRVSPKVAFAAGSTS